MKVIYRPTVGGGSIIIKSLLSFALALCLFTANAQLSLFTTVGGSTYDNGETTPSGFTATVGFTVGDKTRLDSSYKGIVWYGAVAYESYRRDDYVRQYVYSGGFGGYISERTLVTFGLNYRGDRNGQDGQLGFKANTFIDLVRLKKIRVICVGSLGVTNQVQWSAGVGVAYDGF